MSIRIYILDSPIPLTFIFPLEYKQEVKKYTDGTPYLNIQISDNIRMSIDTVTRITFNDPSAKTGGIQRLTDRESIENICDSLDIETNFLEEQPEKI